MKQASKSILNKMPSFGVDAKLLGPKYKEMKELEYRKAIDFWNAHDGSSRFRVKQPAFELEDHGETSSTLALNPAQQILREAQTRGKPLAS